MDEGRWATRAVKVAPGRWRRSIFLRIFVWFWLTTAVVGIAVITLTTLSGTGFVFSLWSRGAGSILALCGDQAVTVLEQQGREAMVDYLRHLQRTHSVSLYVFDESGRELAGREAPPRMKELAAQAARSNALEFALAPSCPLLAKSVALREDARYVVVRELPRGLLNLLFEELQATAPKMILAFLFAGVLCYWLAHHLTTPIMRLQTAARKLAEGDLRVRVGEEVAARRDEISDLGRDFDFMAERIETLMTTLRRFLRDVSHELRSPLARINVALELARQRSSPEAAGYLERIERETGRLNEQVGQLLTLARLESGTATIAREPVDLAPLLREIAEDADFEARSRNCSVRLFEARQVTVAGSMGLLRSALENVVRNAVRHTGEDTEVEISLEEKRENNASHALIRVLDHGEGIPDAELGRLLTPHYRVVDESARETGGTGIGLAITERAIKLHGGSVTMANSEGGGLLVEITIPTAPLSPE